MGGSNRAKISRRRFMGNGIAGGIGLTGGALLGWPYLLTGCSSEGRRPNVIFIITDDQPASTIGCFGGKVHTPHIDSLARGGVRFTRAYASTPVCTPSRYTCLTGRFASRCRDERFLRDNPPGSQSDVRWNTDLETDGFNVARVLQKAGYRTGFVGKWHNSPVSRRDNIESLGLIRPSVDADPGDSETAAILERNQKRMAEILKEFGFDHAASLYFGNMDQILPRKLRAHNMEWVVQGAVDFLEKSGEQPFFLMMSTTLHHLPDPAESLSADPRITGAGYRSTARGLMPQRQAMAGRLRKAGVPQETAASTWLDDGVGAVLGKLDQLGLADDTAVFFFSDHNSAAKATLYEGGVRTPFLLQWKRGIEGGRRSDSLVENIDFVPTILDICGVTPPRGMKIDGRTLLPMLAGKERAAHDDLYLEIGWTRAVVTSRYKYLAVRVPKDYTVVIPRDRPEMKKPWHVGICVPFQVQASRLYPGYWDRDQLYDLEKDPGEQTNLAGDPAHAEVLAEMKSRLQRHLAAFPHKFAELTGG